MANVRLCLETGLAYEHDNSQLECLFEETHSQNKVAFGVEYKTKQMAFPSNNVLNKHKIREKQHKQLARYRVSSTATDNVTP